MAQKYANVWSRAAARLTAFSHTQAGVLRWGVLVLLTAVWFGGGIWLWRELPFSEALYRTFSAVSMWDAYFDAREPMREVVRYAALAADRVRVEATERAIIEIKEMNLRLANI